jgi:hypothetical protein
MQEVGYFEYDYQLTQYQASAMAETTTNGFHVAIVGEL